MADRYWVGGTGDWVSYDDTVWSDTSGGAGGFSVPTAADNVFFDAGSDAGDIFTVTMVDAGRCNNFTASGLDFTMTLAGSVSLIVSGSLAFPATNFARTYTGTTTFNATTTGKTVTTNGVTFASVTFNGVGGGWTLGSACTILGITTLTNGTLNLASYTLTTGRFSSTNSNTRTLAFGTGLISCYTSGIAWTTAISTNLTVTGTGTISLTSASAKTFAGGGAGGYAGITLNQGGAGTLTITDSNTFNNITNTYKSTGATSIRFTAGTTSTFTNWNASGESTRLLTIGSVTAATHTLSIASGTVSADYLSISYSVATGGAAWYAGANSTDGGNNTGWTFTAPPAANRYWVGGTGTWNQTSTANWSATSGGSPGASAPTYTDAVFFDANSGGGTVDVQDTGGATLPSCESLDFDGFTGTFDSSSGVLEVFGDITLSSDNAANFELFTPNIYGTSCTIDSQSRLIKDLYAGGVSQTTGLEYSPTVSLYNNTLYCGVFVFRQGTFNSGGQEIQAQYFLWGTADAVKSTTINMQNGYFAITNSVTPGQGWGILYHTSPSEVTVNADDSIIDFVNSDNSLVACSMYLYNGATSSISSSGKTYYKFDISQNYGTSGSQITIYGNNTFDRIRVYNGSQAITLTFAAGSTQTISSFYAEGAAGGLVTLQSTSPGSQFTLYQATGIVSQDYLSIKDSAATGAAIWYAGANSTNVSNNTGWIFTAQPPVNRYWVGGTGTWTARDSTPWSATSGGAGGVYAPTSIDAVFIDANSGGGTITLDNTNDGYLTAGSLNCTGFTGTIVALEGYYAPLDLYGNLTLGAGGTYGIQNQFFEIYLSSSGTIVSNGTNNPYLDIDTRYDAEVTLTLGDEIKVYGINITSTNTLNTNNYDITTTSYLQATYAATINLGSSSITVTYFVVDPDTTVNAGTSTINMRIDVQDPYDWEFYGGGHTYYNLNFLTDSDTVDSYGGVHDSNTFHSITNSAQPINVIFQSGYTQTITGTFGVSGTSGNLVTIRSELPGTQFTLVKASGTVSSDYLSLQDSNATGGASWYAGTHSTNVSNNLGWLFSNPALTYDPTRMLAFFFP